MNLPELIQNESGHGDLLIQTNSSEENLQEKYLDIKEKTNLTLIQSEFRNTKFQLYCKIKK